MWGTALSTSQSITGTHIQTNSNSHTHRHTRTMTCVKKLGKHIRVLQLRRFPSSTAVKFRVIIFGVASRMFIVFCFQFSSGEKFITIFNKFGFNCVFEMIDIFVLFLFLLYAEVWYLLSSFWTCNPIFFLFCRMKSRMLRLNIKKKKKHSFFPVSALTESGCDSHTKWATVSC